MKNCELSIDHPMLKAAKTSLDYSMKAMIEKALQTGSMEGSVNLKISFEIIDLTDKETGETYQWPQIEFKAGFSVPIKDSVDGKIIEKSRLMRNKDGELILVAGQISMDELMQEG